MAPFMMGYRIQDGLLSAPQPGRRSLGETICTHWSLCEFKNRHGGTTQPVMQCFPPGGDRLEVKVCKRLVPVYSGRNGPLHCACSCGLLHEHRPDQTIDWEEVRNETDNMPWLTKRKITCNATLCEYMVECAKAAKSATIFPRVQVAEQCTCR